MVRERNALKEMTNVEKRSTEVTKPKVLELTKSKVTDNKNLVREKKKKEAPIKAETEARKKKGNVNDKKNKITASDLTEDEPSERYWKVIAEKRRVALKEAVEENALLHKTIDLLTKENATLKQALCEATAAIEVFNEIVADHEESQSSEEKASSS